MVYTLTFEDVNQLMKHPSISSSSSTELPSFCLSSSVPIGANRAPSPSENNLLMRCMQKLGHYPACNSRVLEENNGQCMNASSGKGEGGADDQLHAAAAAGGGGCMPRPRWCPTPEQIQVLEALFNSGTTTPSRDMIVEIAACLKQFGSIVEANVFYWFQNRKARAKRKLRMQAQLKQQQAAAGASAAPADSDNPPACAPVPLSHTALQVPLTGRRVCARTTLKASPNAFSASDHHLPPLVHIPASVTHADRPTAATCSLINHDQHAAAPYSTSLPVINTSSSKTMPSPNADHSLCISSCTTIPKKQSISGHVLQQGMISQAMPSLIISRVPQPLSSDHEATDHHFNHVQNHIVCNQYVDQMSNYGTTARVSSRPGSADSNNVMISSCGMLQQPPVQLEPAAAPSAAITNSHFYPSTAAPNFIESVAQNHKELSVVSLYSGDNYTNTPAAYTSTSTASTSSYPDQIESSSLSLPHKRSWMEALMQQFVSSQDTAYNRPSITSTHIMDNMYSGDMDNYTARAHTSELFTNPSHSNDLLQPSQTLNPSKDAPRHASILYTSNLSREYSMNSSHVSNIGSVIKEVNDGDDTKQYMFPSSSSPSHGAYHDLHDGVTKRDMTMETFNMCSNSTLISQQHGAFATSPPMFHHCDHLPLWEALAPYMSIGS